METIGATKSSAAKLSIWDVDPVELAAATSLALLAGQCKKDGSRESRHCNAAMTLRTGPGDLLGKRNVVREGRVSVSPQPPFRRTAYFGEGRPFGFPTVLPRIVKLIEFSRPSSRNEQDAVELRASSPQYPEAAPYVTGYMGVLTDAVLRPLRFSLKKRLAKRLRERGFPGQARPVGQQSETFLDTEEKTFERLSEALTGCIVSKAMDFKQLSSVNTILLFGPPGTGKTTVVERLTDHLNERDTAEPNDRWYLLELIPSVFLVSDCSANCR